MTNDLMYNPVDIRSFVTAETIYKLSARNKDINNTFLFMDHKSADEYDANNVDKQQSVKRLYLYLYHPSVRVRLMVCWNI